VLFDEGYWRSVVNFEAMIAAGMVAPADMSLFRFAETPEAVWQALVDGGLSSHEELDEPSPDPRDLA
jgi:predicted Rossmann-fold nucleotide-binding protein